MKKFIIAVSPPLVLVLLVLLVLSCAERQWPPLDAAERSSIEARLDDTKLFDQSPVNPEYINWWNHHDWARVSIHKDACEVEVESGWGDPCTDLHETSVVYDESGIICIYTADGQQSCFAQSELVER